LGDFLVDDDVLAGSCVRPVLSLNFVFGRGDLVVLGSFRGGRGGECSSMDTTEASSRMDGLLVAVDVFGTIESRTTPGNEEEHGVETT
jgi:hypothetical protein